MNELVPACQVCGDLPTQFARAWPHETQYGTLFVCDRCRRSPAIDTVKGRVCRRHFDLCRTSRPPMSEAIFCRDCRQALEDERDRVQKNETIDPSQPWGQHIALTCVNHPDLRWTPKNISHIGARHIFFAGDGGECACPARDLIVAPRD